MNEIVKRIGIGLVFAFLLGIVTVMLLSIFNPEYFEVDSSRIVVTGIMIVGFLKGFWINFSSKEIKEIK